MLNEIIIPSNWHLIGFIITCLFVAYLLFELLETVDSKQSYNAMKSGYKKLTNEFIQNCQIL